MVRGGKVYKPVVAKLPWVFHIKLYTAFYIAVNYHRLNTEVFF